MRSNVIWPTSSGGLGWREVLGGVSCRGWSSRSPVGRRAVWLSGVGTAVSVPAWMAATAQERAVQRHLWLSATSPPETQGRASTGPLRASEGVPSSMGRQGPTPTYPLPPVSRGSLATGHT